MRSICHIHLPHILCPCSTRRCWKHEIQGFYIDPVYFQRVLGTALGWPFWDASSKLWALEIKKSRVYGCAADPKSRTKNQTESLALSHQLQCSSLLVVFLLLPLLLLLIMITTRSAEEGGVAGLLLGAWTEVVSTAKECTLPLPFIQIPLWMQRYFLLSFP